MKKLLTLVLSLAMVFAIAAPAMAASWSDANTYSNAPYGVEVTLLQQNYDSVGKAYYTAFPANGAVVAGTPVFFKVSYDIPTAAELSRYYADTNFGTNGATIKLTNIAATKIMSQEKVYAGAPTDLTNDTAAPFYLDGSAAKVTFANLASGAVYHTTYSAIISGYVVTTGEATVAASIGYTTKYAVTGNYLDWYDIDLAGISVGDTVTTGKWYTLVEGEKVYEGVDEDTQGAILETKNYHDGYALQFSKTNADKIKGWKLVVGGFFPGASTSFTTEETLEAEIPADEVYDIYMDLGKIIFVGADGTKVTDKHYYQDLLDAYEELTDVLGFKYGDDVIYSENNILAFFGYTDKVTDSKSYKPYTTSLTVSDTAAVPNTGDSVSVIGFVMVGLALLATAAVVVKKVRA